MTKLVEFSRDVKREALKITWPTRKEVGLTTMMIVLMAVFAAIFFFVVDKILSVGIQAFLGL